MQLVQLFLLHVLHGLHILTSDMQHTQATKDMQSSLATESEAESNTMVRVSEGLLRRAKATAAMQGETLKQFFSAALEERVERLTGGK